MSIYLDNAATSFPKPPEIMEAMVEFQSSDAANPGRSGHRMSIAAGRVLYDARDRLAALFNVSDPLDIVITMNATMALNTAIMGFLKSGDHVVTTSMEHNSVARPLRWLESKGMTLSVVAADTASGVVAASDIIGACLPETRLIVMTHASNVTGSIMPVAEVGRAARKLGIRLLVDAAQTAGALPIDVRAMNIDMLAFTGHKCLFGPMGTGGLFVAPDIELNPLMRGGTGSRSEKDTQPDFMPDRLESGTPNTIGAAGLAAGLRFIERTGLAAIMAKKKNLTTRFLKGVENIPSIRVYGPPPGDDRLSVVSLNVAGRDCSNVAQRLDEDFAIMARSGLHCSPWAHQAIGSFPDGAVRLSFGYLNTNVEIDAALAALKEIAS